MPFFKSTLNIFKKPWEDEVFNENWMDSDKLVLPPKYDWDYSRELTIEDVDIWEVIYESGGGWGLYASWCPYAEFYMLLTGWNNITKSISVETFYGAGTQEKIQKRIKELNLPIGIKKVYVEESDMWLYNKEEPKKLYIP